MEPGVPPLADRLQTLYSICHLYPEYGSRVVQISYDPMMLYYDDINDPEHAHPLNNLSRFDDVVHAASKLGIPTIHMSFYQKMGMISGANARRADLSFPVLTPEQQLALLRTHVFPVLHRYKDTVTLNTCTAIPVLGLLSADERKLMTRGFCLSPEYVNQFLDTKLTKLKTCGRPYCGCVDRVDGANKLRGGCVHGCVYCFANSTKGGEPDLECDGGDDLTDIEDLA